MFGSQLTILAFSDLLKWNHLQGVCQIKAALLALLPKPQKALKLWQLAREAQWAGSNTMLTSLLFSPSEFLSTARVWGALQGQPGAALWLLKGNFFPSSSGHALCVAITPYCLATNRQKRWWEQGYLSCVPVSREAGRQSVLGQSHQWVYTIQEHSIRHYKWVFVYVPLWVSDTRVCILPMVTICVTVWTSRPHWISLMLHYQKKEA